LGPVGVLGGLETLLPATFFRGSRHIATPSAYWLALFDKLEGVVCNVSTLIFTPTS